MKRWKSMRNVVDIQIGFVIPRYSHWLGANVIKEEHKEKEQEKKRRKRKEKGGEKERIRKKWKRMMMIENERKRNDCGWTLE